MYYWNHDNFTGLVTLGEYLAQQSRYTDLAKYSLDYHTHHLDEGYFIGELAEAKERITAAKSLLSKLLSTSLTNYLNEEVEYYENLVRDWQRFNSAERGGQSFLSWCQENRLGYQFSKKYYYS